MKATKTQHDRHAFIGTGLIALGVTLPQASAVQDTIGPDDPVLTELGALAQRGARVMRSKPGEGLRQVATAARLRSAHGRSQGIDAWLKTALRRAIRERGRDAVLILQPDARMVEEETKALGWPGTVPSPNLAERGQLLDLLLHDGYTAYLRGLSGQLDYQAQLADERLVGLRPVQYQAWEICPILNRQIQHINFFQAIYCTPLLWWTYMALQIECAFLGGALAGTYAQMYYYGC
jgi:hypothetical protein